MENVRVVVIDDEPSIRKLVEVHLSRAGHSVVASIGTLEAAMLFIKSGSIGELDAKIVILDGNLTLGQYSCEDGRSICKAIKAVDPKIIVIAFTAQTKTEAGFGDEFVRKDGSTEAFRGMKTIIAELPEPTKEQ